MDKDRSDRFGWKEGDIGKAELSQCAECVNNDTSATCEIFGAKPPEFWDNIIECPERKVKKVSK